VLLIDGRTLTIESVGLVALEHEKVSLDPEAIERVRRARALVEQKAASGEAVYGINTGFGYLKNVRIKPDELDALQVNLIRSHAVGVGEPLSTAQTRALMVLRANVLATGRSGVRLATLQCLLNMLNRGIHPQIPCKGSVGASGDLAPLAHLALAMIGEGEVEFRGARVSSSDALRESGLQPLQLGPKEGLCLVNGTQAMSALACLALLEAEDLACEADIVGATSLEGRRGTVTAFKILIVCAACPKFTALAATFFDSYAKPWRQK
jgi:histidine ammonia-lyase